MKAIDLGKPYDSTVPKPAETPKKAKHYPTVYLSDVEGLDMDIGDVTFTVKGRVVSCTERKTSDGRESYSCELELHSLIPAEGGDIEDAFNKVAKKKAAKMEMDEED